MGKRGRRERVTRRDFLRTTGTTAVVASTGVGAGLLGCEEETTDTDGGTSTDGGGRRELRILTWQNFVPEYDTWFDQFAQSWGDANGVDVTVDHVPVTEIPGMFQSQLDAGEGHDLVEFVSAPANLEPFVVDLTDVNEEAASRVGAQLSLCNASSFNPVTNKYFGFCHAWLPDPGVYRRSLWEGIGMADGPRTWQQLLDGGSMIRTNESVPVGIGLAPEIDSNMALRALLWSFDASIQNASREVVINGPNTIEAIDYAVQLYTDAMVPDVLSWGPADNNNALIDRTASYILNSISAYRTAQDTVPTVAEDVFFVPALEGPRGTALVGPHGVITYVVPQHSPNVSAAKDFLLAYAESYNEAVFASKLYYFPAFAETTPQLTEAMGWLDSDPFESRPLDKLSILKTAESWSAPLGHPGSANPAIGEIFGAGIVPMMFAKAATGELTSAEAAAWAEEQIAPIFDRWRMEGLV